MTTIQTMSLAQELETTRQLPQGTIKVDNIAVAKKADTTKTNDNEAFKFDPITEVSLKLFRLNIQNHFTKFKTLVNTRSISYENLNDLSKNISDIKLDLNLAKQNATSEEEVKALDSMIKASEKLEEMIEDVMKLLDKIRKIKFENNEVLSDVDSLERYLSEAFRNNDAIENTLYKVYTYKGFSPEITTGLLYQHINKVI